MKKCWETQPQDRPSFAELVKMLNKLLQTPKDRPPAPPPRTGTIFFYFSRYSNITTVMCYNLFDLSIYLNPDHRSNIILILTKF